MTRMKSCSPWLALLGLAFFTVQVGCSSGVKVDHSNCTGPVERTEARVAIEGMMCEIACVAKVKKELLELGGVAEVHIEFDIHQKVDTAYISFDSEKVSAADMVEKVEAIGNGLYKVHNVNVVHFAPSAE
jgi:copper chaperone CopZ